MKKKMVIVGGSAGARIAAEIFTETYREILYLETYAKDINVGITVGKKIPDGLDFLKRDKIDYFIATGDNKLRKENFDER